MVTDLYLSQNISATLIKARNDAKKTQSFMAKALGKSKNTICNWELGICVPNSIDLFKWFYVLNLDPVRYLIDAHKPQDQQSTKSSKEFLHYYIDNVMNEDVAKQLEFNMREFTGSSFAQQVSLITVHNCSSMPTRVRSAQSSLDAYKMDKQLQENAYDCDSFVDLEKLQSTIIEGRKAAYNKQQRYII